MTSTPALPADIPASYVPSTQSCRTPSGHACVSGNCGFGIQLQFLPAATGFPPPLASPRSPEIPLVPAAPENPAVLPWLQKETAPRPHSLAQTPADTPATAGRTSDGLSKSALMLARTLWVRHPHAWPCIQLHPECLCTRQSGAALRCTSLSRPARSPTCQTFSAWVLRCSGSTVRT